jgi:hypothetical protein
MSQSDENGSIWKRIQSIPDNVVMGVFILTMVVPLLVPVSLPAGITPPVRQFHEYIENMPDGSVVVFATQLIPFNYGDNAPSTAAVFNFLINSPNLKVILVFESADAPIMFDITSEEYGIVIPEWRKYGEDWVRFGFYPGLESGVSVLADDISAMYSTDYFGTPIEELPMMEDIKSAADFDLWVQVTSWTYVAEYIVRQIYARYGVPIAFSPAGMTIMTVIPYYPHITPGFVMGLSGAPQLNQLTGFKSELGNSLANAFSFMVLWTIILAILGVVGGIMEERSS